MSSFASTRIGFSLSKISTAVVGGWSGYDTTIPSLAGRAPIPPWTMRISTKRSPCRLTPESTGTQVGAAESAITRSGRIGSRARKTAACT